MIEHCAVSLLNCTFTTVQKVLKEEVVADVSLFKSNGRQVDLISVSVPLWTTHAAKCKENTEQSSRERSCNGGVPGVDSTLSNFLICLLPLGILLLLLKALSGSSLALHKVPHRPRSDQFKNIKKQSIRVKEESPGPGPTLSDDDVLFLRSINQFSVQVWISVVFAFLASGQTRVTQIRRSGGVLGSFSRIVQRELWPETRCFWFMYLYWFIYIYMYLCICCF